MRLLMQFSACFALGLVVAGVLLIGLMFTDQSELLLRGFNLSGKPLSGLALTLLPESFWNDLTGIPDAVANASVRSFLQLCTALGQIALLLAAGFFRLWYWR
ncbi:hypothetical protein H3H51_02515 [Pseudomonas sp. UL070]|uniref:Uncharacterized protein n=1 Tax=Aquipseudomonas ullengensis TaxID=2759166 RepID=A0A7W4Q8Q7_9GAMM|nr:hypothetical protein [Pseudomonas ullengensis]MBB2493874.1 hypothetical protein [Pseudomonas ullengensis]